ncbi:MAG: N-acetyl-1-D-myo-inositol-2-amino-2-deoxy-alpha-D-glucopyranoside deacetylase [Chloroflexota bacterium]
MANQEDRLTVMAVHAHPDDEVFSTGATLAKYSAKGYRTVLVTCTDGAAGEVFDPTLGEEEKQQTFAQIKEVRVRELAESVRLLGITHQHYLGYRDSGMIGTPDNHNPESFHRAVFHEAVGRLVTLIRLYRPQVLLTYDEFGGYGHPDHLQAQRITTIAFGVANDGRLYRGGESDFTSDYEPWQPAKLYYAGRPRSMMHRMVQDMRKLGIKGWWDDPEYESIPRGTPDEQITTRIDGRDLIELKQAAFRAHRTQLAPDSFVFIMPPEKTREYLGYEYFGLAQHRVPLFKGLGGEGYEEDLFEGIQADLIE